MCRQHIVVRGNDCDIRTLHQLQLLLVRNAAGGDAMREITAAQIFSTRMISFPIPKIFEILFPMGPTSSSYRISHRKYRRVDWRHLIDLIYEIKQRILGL